MPAARNDFAAGEVVVVGDAPLKLVVIRLEATGLAEQVVDLLVSDDGCRLNPTGFGGTAGREEAGEGGVVAVFVVGTKLRLEANGEVEDTRFLLLVVPSAYVEWRLALGAGT